MNRRESTRLPAALFVVVALVLSACAGCGEQPEAKRTRELRIFHASGLSPSLEAVREDCLRRLSVKLLTEAGGSQVACRKATELGRDCDLIMLADSTLVASLLAGTCSWRLDFANDEVVLGVGLRAPYVDEAEDDWVSVLTRDDVRIGRVDENQGPIGYRSLLVWKLQEIRGSSGLYGRLLGNCDKVVDHVTRLTPLLKNGEIDYAFVYRSICIARDIRHIELDKAINLSSAGADYSGAEVTFDKLKVGEKQTVTVRGAPITWTLSVPDRGADIALAAEFIRYLLTEKGEVLERTGLRPIGKPRFYGPAEAFEPFAAFAAYGGELK